MKEKFEIKSIEKKSEKEEPEPQPEIETWEVLNTKEFLRAGM